MKWNEIYSNSTVPKLCNIMLMNVSKFMYFLVINAFLCKMSSYRIWYQCNRVLHITIFLLISMSVIDGTKSSIWSNWDLANSFNKIMESSFGNFHFWSNPKFLFTTLPYKKYSQRVCCYFDEDLWTILMKTNKCDFIWYKRAKIAQN